jgi:hypothetical protein
VAVGAPFDGEGSSRTGSVFVYKEVSENVWELQNDKITPEDGVKDGAFGISVDIDKESLVVGSRVRLISTHYSRSANKCC